MFHLPMHAAWFTLITFPNLITVTGPIVLANKTKNFSSGNRPLPVTSTVLGQSIPKNPQGF
jgi:hypothetical protein